MEFPLSDLLNRDKCRQWILEHFHPDGLSCPTCNAGVEQARKFRTTHCDPLDPPRRRANKQRGKGTYDNDRPPIVGTIGRSSGQVRLRVGKNTTGETLVHHVHQFTLTESQLFTDESASYNRVIRFHATGCHSQHEWARDDDGDGIREVHVNTTEGIWTDVRNFLRPFKGIHKDRLSGYLAIFEFKRNLKCISPTFIASLVTLHISYS